MLEVEQERIHREQQSQGERAGEARKRTADFKTERMRDGEAVQRVERAAKSHTAIKRSKRASRRLLFSE